MTIRTPALQARLPARLAFRVLQHDQGPNQEPLDLQAAESRWNGFEMNSQDQGGKHWGPAPLATWVQPMGRCQ